MSIQEQFADNTASALPAGATLDQDLVKSFRFAPSRDWAAPANVNDRPSQQEPLAKRSLDLAVSMVALIALLPLLALVALAIRLDTGGPVFFRQTRLGRGGRPFNIFKFRTMNVAENGASIVQACHNDARITRVGAFLRKTSLDELPQLLNVIFGQMSLVGPRPHARAHDIYYASHIANYALRQRVKPGITGWAQIHGLRGETRTVDAMRERISYDIWYAQNASVATDLLILLRTPLEVIRCRNAV